MQDHQAVIRKNACGQIETYVWIDGALVSASDAPEASMIPGWTWLQESLRAQRSKSVPRQITHEAASHRVDFLKLETWMTKT